MIINLSKDYRINSDNYQIILQKSRTVEKDGSKNIGKVSWDSISFHTTLENALKSCLHSKFLESDAEVTLEGLSVLFNGVLEDFKANVPEAVQQFKSIRRGEDL